MEGPVEKIYYAVAHAAIADNFMTFDDSDMKGNLDKETRKKLSKAEEYYKIALAEIEIYGPGSEMCAMLQINIGVIYSYFGEHEKAVGQYEKTLENAEDARLRSYIYHNIGYEYEKAGKFDLAIKNYDKAIECWEGNSRSHLRKGLIAKNINN